GEVGAPGKRATLLGVSVGRGCGGFSQQPVEEVIGLSTCRRAACQLGLGLCASLEVAVRGRRLAGLFRVDQVAERERPDLVLVAEYLAGEVLALARSRPAFAAK